MRIAQISDLHILDLEAISARDFWTKRVTGGLNLLTGRLNAHPLELAERLVEDLSVQQLDHVVVTGDVTNLSLPGEFQRAARLLRLLGGYDKLTVIPGNHDVYTRGSANHRRFESYFGHLLFGEDSRPRDWVFPAVKDIGDVVIIGLSSAQPTPFFMSYGAVGPEQIDRLERRLESPRYQAKFKVALVHHNVHRRNRWKEWSSRLLDRDALVQRLMDLRVDLLLHGHSHRAHRFTVTRNGHTMVVAGSGSSTWRTNDPERSARYNIYVIERGLERIRTRAYDPRKRRFDWHV